jgi:glutamate racemase
MHSDKAAAPIGIFDSGIGGLTVAKAIVDALPHESIMYFGDTAHMPYGEKSADAIRYYSLKIAKFLLDKDCKMIVIACNSASSAAYHTLLDFFRGQALIVNVVDPLVDYVVQQGFHKVGVIATKATINSRIYEQKIREKNQQMDVFSLATPLLAPMIEEGFADRRIRQSVIDSYLDHPGFEGIQALLLACTHYPLIREEIVSHFNNEVQVIDSTQVVAEQVKLTLETHGLLQKLNREPNRQFFVSDLTPSFESATALFFGEQIQLNHASIW